MEKPLLKIITDNCELQNNLKDFNAEVREVTIPAVNLPEETINPLTVPSIKSHSDDEIFSVVLMSLARSFTDLGREQLGDRDKNYLANSLADLIPRKYPSIRLHEIPEAFAKGIRGKYGEFYGLSVVSFENFIEAHLAHESREQFAKLLPVVSESKEPDQDTKFKIAKENAIKAFKDYSIGKDISLSALIVYSFLDGLKLIEFTPEEKWEFVEEAVQFLETDLLRKSIETLNKHQRADYMKQILAVKNRTAVDLIKNTAKRFTLYAFFKSCIMESLDINDLIQYKRQLFQ